MLGEQQLAVWLKQFPSWRRTGVVIIVQNMIPSSIASFAFVRKVRIARTFVFFSMISVFLVVGIVVKSLPLNYHVEAIMLNCVTGAS